MVCNPLSIDPTTNVQYPKHDLVCMRTQPWTLTFRTRGRPFNLQEIMVRFNPGNWQYHCILPDAKFVPCFTKVKMTGNLAPYRAIFGNTPCVIGCWRIMLVYIKTWNPRLCERCVTSAQLSSLSFSHFITTVPCSLAFGLVTIATHSLYCKIHTTFALLLTFELQPSGQQNLLQSAVAHSLHTYSIIFHHECCRGYADNVLW